MGLSLGRVRINGRIKGYNVSNVPGIFEGTNTETILPIAFAGNSNTFTSSVQNILPIEYGSSSVNTFTAIVNSSLPLVFTGTNSNVLMGRVDNSLPIEFSGSTP